MIPVFKAIIQNGEIVPDNPEKFTEYLKGLHEKTVEVLIQKFHMMRDKRSLSQNAYMWGVVYKLIAEHTGHSEDEIHEYCKIRFLGKRLWDQIIPGSTKILDTIKFEDYMEKVRGWASSDLGVVIPLPNEVAIEI